jgi:hypothetical protein
MLTIEFSKLFLLIELSLSVFIIIDPFGDFVLCRLLVDGFDIEEELEWLFRILFTIEIKSMRGVNSSMIVLLLFTNETWLI